LIKRPTRPSIPRLAAGQAITIRHAEVLEHDELGVRPLRDAQATDTFIMSGCRDRFEPTKTFHGFRYAEVTGWPGELTPNHERLGWTGDITVFAPTAAFLHDVDAFPQDWLVDLALEQAATGYVPIVVPDRLKLQRRTFGSEEFTMSPVQAIWSDAAVWVPWALWQAYGDRTVLERQ
jgi:alpha-L-rhamnosidase